MRVGLSLRGGCGGVVVEGGVQSRIGYSAGFVEKRELPAEMSSASTKSLQERGIEGGRGGGRPSTVPALMPKRKNMMRCSDDEDVDLCAVTLPHRCCESELLWMNLKCCKTSD